MLAMGPSWKRSGPSHTVRGGWSEDTGLRAQLGEQAHSDEEETPVVSKDGAGTQSKAQKRRPGHLRL